MADPVTATVAVGVGLIGASATLLGAAATGTVAVGALAYNIHKDRKQARDNSNKEPAKKAEAKMAYEPNLVYQPSASYLKSGTEKVEFGPEGRFSAVGTSASDWSCGTITYYAPREQPSPVGKQKKCGRLFGRSAGPPPYK